MKSGRGAWERNGKEEGEGGIMLSREDPLRRAGEEARNEERLGHPEAHWCP
jgi:hypothetical protein